MMAPVRLTGGAFVGEALDCRTAGSVELAATCVVRDAVTVVGDTVEELDAVLREVVDGDAVLVRVLDTEAELEALLDAELLLPLLDTDPLEVEALFVCVVLPEVVRVRAVASIVVGSLSDVADAVRGTLAPVIDRREVMPVANASTVVAKLLAVPHPYW
jgi:hypothetical protein